MGLAGTDSGTVYRFGSLILCAADASPRQLRSAALAAIGYWRQQLGYPLLDPLTERAYRAAVRSCEAIVSNAA